MRKPELDTVRQVLETALRNLREDAAENGTAPQSAAVSEERSACSESRRTEAPIIVIIAGELKTHSDEATRQEPVILNVASEPGKATSGVSDYSERKVSHPGLERFTIEADSRPSAPKACFMEPSRSCVNSGACEMRGF
jgi:hypothetical protein